MGAGDSPRPRGDGARLIVDCDALAELVGECTAALARGRIVVAAGRALPEATPVKLQLDTGALVAPIVLTTTVMDGCGDGGGEVTLELAPAEQERLAALVERITAGDPALVAPVARVLIADDNPHLAELIRAGLTGSSRRPVASAPALRFEFAVAADGASALAVIAGAPFDVAIVGVYLAPLGAAQLIARVRAHAGPRLPIIAIASEAQPAQRLAFAAGADAFMEKPVRLRSIYDGIVTLLDGRARSVRA